MSLEAKCACGKVLEVADKLAGTRGSCPYCGEEIQYPAKRPKTTRIVISIGDDTTRLEAGKLAGGSTRRLSDLDEETQKKAIRTIVIIFICLAGGAYLAFVRPRMQHTAQLSEARDTIFSAMREAEALETGRSYLEAYNRFKAILARSEWYLKSVDPDDVEVAEARDRAAERLDALMAGNLVQRQKPGRAAGGSGGESKERPTILELLEQHPGDVFFDLPSRVSDSTSHAVAGLGLMASSTTDDIIARWEEPANRRPEQGAPGIERWVYRVAHGFDLEVRSADDTSVASTIETIHIHPNFKGFVNGIKVRGSTVEIWRQRVGPPETGSMATVMRYRHPFSGYVRFDASGAFQELKISFQSRQ